MFSSPPRLFVVGACLLSLLASAQTPNKTITALPANKKILLSAAAQNAKTTAYFRKILGGKTARDFMLVVKGRPSAGLLAALKGALAIPADALGDKDYLIVTTGADPQTLVANSRLMINGGEMRFRELGKGTDRSLGNLRGFTTANAGPGGRVSGISGRFVNGPLENGRISIRGGDQCGVADLAGLPGNSGSSFNPGSVGPGRGGSGPGGVRPGSDRMNGGDSDFPGTTVVFETSDEIGIFEVREDAQGNRTVVERDHQGNITGIWEGTPQDYHDFEPHTVTGTGGSGGGGGTSDPAPQPEPAPTPEPTPAPSDGGGEGDPAPAPTPDEGSRPNPDDNGSGGGASPRTGTAGGRTGGKGAGINVGVGGKRVGSPIPIAPRPGEGDYRPNPEDTSGGGGPAANLFRAGFGNTLKGPAALTSNLGLFVGIDVCNKKAAGQAALAKSFQQSMYKKLNFHNLSAAKLGKGISIQFMTRKQAGK